jgi:hypothetical protein
MKPALNESPQAVVFSGFIFSAGNSVKIPFCAAKVGFVPRVTIIMLFNSLLFKEINYFKSFS